ncbi:MAG: tripartite tricarboxylate transporter substrate binding protein [Betaproteobacteria bacterium]|nr:tripartite tricarboxylate transporter substrate binding protein [Betaproteobacteria bacterium]
MTTTSTKIFALLLATLLPTTAAHGQAYPGKVVRILIPFSTGSGSDTIGRVYAAGLSEALGQQVIVENRAGAAGNIGAELAARAAPDGYTLLFVNIAHAVNVSMYRKLAYDPLRDFAPVSLLATGPAMLVAHPSLPVKSVKELVALAKARPGAIQQASAGVGTFTFLAAEFFKRQAAIDLLHVPYRSGGEAITSIVSGETSVYFSPFAAALPQVKQGRLRPLAITSVKRLSLAPEVPTVAESGYPKFDFGNWYGIVVPAKTPRDIIDRVRAASVTALNNANISKRLQDSGFVLIGGTPEEFGAYFRAEIEAWGKIVRELKLSAD